jgi:hypothetical protein
MKYIVKYFYIKTDHPLSIPQFNHREMIEVNSIKELDKYIKTKKDQYGNSFSKSKDKFLGFDYTSNAGGIKVIEYKEPTFKRI